MSIFLERYLCLNNALLKKKKNLFFWQVLFWTQKRKPDGSCLKDTLYPERQICNALHKYRRIMHTHNSPQACGQLLQIIDQIFGIGEGSTYTSLVGT